MFLALAAELALARSGEAEETKARLAQEQLDEALARKLALEGSVGGESGSVITEELAKKEQENDRRVQEEKDLAAANALAKQSEKQQGQKEELVAKKEKVSCFIICQIHLTFS